MFEFDKIKIEIIDDENISSDKKEESKEAEISLLKKDIKNNAVIIILSCIIFLLLLFMVSMRIIDEHNRKLHDELNVISSVVINEAQKEEISLKVNINSDNVFELTQLPGIGTSKANAIINYRKENGDFDNVEELKNVTGIGEATYNNILPFIFIE